MSADPRNRSSWISQNYDKLILIVMLIGLLGSATFLFLEIGRNRQEVIEARWETPSIQPKIVAPADIAVYEQQKAFLTQPFASASLSNALMVSELRVSCVECEKPIPFSALTCPFCGAAQPEIKDIKDRDSDFDGIPDLVEEKYGLNPLDATDVAQDLDRDGFSNIEEIQSGTDPRDPLSAPSPVAKLRVYQVATNPFKLRFQGAAKLSDETVRYQVNLRSLEKTYFVRVGDEIEGFRVLEYLPKEPDGQTLILQQGATNIKLVKGMTYNQYELVAGLVFLIDGTRSRVRVGDAMNLKGREYKVIDIKRDGVLIRDEKTSKSTLIGRLSEREKQTLLGGAESSVQTGQGTPGQSRSVW